MTKRIFKYMETTILLTLVAGFFAILLALYSYFGAVQINQLNGETDLAARGVETAGEDYLSSLILKNPATRITLIDQDGTVLYDNKADPATMENHSDRPEFQEAIQSGVGDSTRFSNTLTTEMLYSAKRLSDGKVLRIAESRNTVLTIAMGMVAPMLWIFVLLLIVNWISAMHVSKRIIEPLNNIDLDHPIDNDTYPEVSPLLRRIHQQQEEIAKQQEELARTEKEITTVTNHMEEGLMMISEAGRVLSINTKAQKLLHTDADCLGSDILTLERRIEFQEALDAATEGKHGEAILTYSGHTYQVDISPIAEGEHTSGMVVLFFDVTEKINAENVRREFSSNVSHELKTPLHTISGCAELLESGGVKPEDTKHFIHLIYQETQRMISLVEDILYISHLDEGAVDLKWEELNLHDIAEKTIDNLQAEAEKKNVTMTLEGDSAPIFGIRRLMESIAFNLIDNAIKYNKENGTVDVSVKDLGDKIRFSVADSGIGIPEDDIPRIFERFYRVDKSHSREIGGTGLGLSIVKHAAILQHAKIDVQSVPEQGTMFSITFDKEECKKQAEAQDETL